MSPNWRKGIKYSLVGLWITTVAAFLALSLGNALRLYNSRHLEPAPEMTTFRGFRPGVPNELLIWLALCALLYWLVQRHPERILLLSTVAAAGFLAVNLYFGRHVLPLSLIPPTPNNLVNAYVAALAEGDPRTAVRLAGTAEVCQALTAAMFAEHAAMLPDELGEQRRVKTRMLDLAYDDSLAEGPWVGRLIPNQPVEVEITASGQEPVSINLTLRYDPIFGRRHLCGN